MRLLEEDRNIPLLPSYLQPDFLTIDALQTCSDGIDASSLLAHDKLRKSCSDHSMSDILVISDNQRTAVSEHLLATLSLKIFSTSYFLWLSVLWTCLVFCTPEALKPIPPSDRLLPHHLLWPEEAFGFDLKRCRRHHKEITHHPGLPPPSHGYRQDTVP